MTYAGWENYPTLIVNLWLSNDEYLYDQTRELIAQGGETYDLADNLKAYVEELAEQVAPQVFEASFVSDLFGYALGQVHWWEIVEAWKDDDE